MFHLRILASSSSGNCALVRAGDCHILVDAGVSATRIRKGLEECGVDPSQLDGILITHEHGDHITGIEVFCRQHDIPVYVNHATADAIGRGKARFLLFETGSGFSIKDLHVQTFRIPHDAADPVGFVLTFGDRSLGFLTDLGHAPRHILERIRNVHTLVIEANYDETMLLNAERPWLVKQRTQSRHGHLSNTAASEIVAGLLGTALRRVVMGHLSRDCNHPDVALKTMRERLAQEQHEAPELYCADPHGMSPMFAIFDEVAVEAVGVLL